MNASARTTGFQAWLVAFSTLLAAAESQLSPREYAAFIDIVLRRLEPQRSRYDRWLRRAA